MSSYPCKCGMRISTTACPNNSELHILTDVEYDELAYGKDILLRDVEFSVTAYKCYECGRLLIYDDNGMATYYKPET